MLQTFRNAWKIDDLRKKILFTLLIIAIYRIGSALPVPFLHPDALKSMLSGAEGIMGYLNVLSGGAMENATIFALSISPYITASIVMQLLTVAIPALEKLQKEGENGQKMIGKITRYVTIGLALMQAVAYFMLLRGANALVYTTGWAMYFSAAVIILCFAAGTALVIWFGEQVNEKGIGNGISMILFAGIVSRGPSAVLFLWDLIRAGIAGEVKFLFYALIIPALFIAIIALVVLMNNAERRIPVQYAKKVVGRKMYGGQSTHMPIKVSMAGVMPIIFAGAILSIPATISMFVKEPAPWLQAFINAFKMTSPIYAIIYFVLIIAFNYFYISLQYNPIEMSNNLKKNSGMIPGIRPGRPTSQFISRVIQRITLVGAIFLGFLAVLPIALTWISGINISLGGTSVLIIVSVAMETVTQLESQMMMRHYKGFLE